MIVSFSIYENPRIIILYITMQTLEERFKLTVLEFHSKRRIAQRNDANRDPICWYETTLNSNFYRNFVNDISAKLSVNSQDNSTFIGNINNWILRDEYYNNTQINATCTNLLGHLNNLSNNSKEFVDNCCEIILNSGYVVNKDTPIELAKLYTEKISLEMLIGWLDNFNTVGQDIRECNKKFGTNISSCADLPNILPKIRGFNNINQLLEFIQFIRSKL